MIDDVVIYLNPHFLTPAMCARVQAAMDRGQQEPAEILVADVAAVPAVRRATSVDVDVETLAAVERRLDAERGAIEAFFETRLGVREGVSLLRYGAGGFYKLHRDRGHTSAWPAAARRHVSIVVFLNSARHTPGSAEFTGGTLRLLDRDQQLLDIVPQQGCLVAFPATTLHEVVPVRSGTRDTMVDWFYSA